MSISPNIWGRVYAQDGSYTWQSVTPDANGDTDYVYITNLIQVLKLSLGESPFYAQYGIPSQRSVVTQIFPDFYVNQTQQQFSKYFASLSITKVTDPQPVYRINIVRNNGSTFQKDIPV